MPEIGEEVKAEVIGKSGGKGKKFVWVYCPSCDEERWVHKQSNLSNLSRLCKPCNIKQNAKAFHL